MTTENTGKEGGSFPRKPRSGEYVLWALALIAVGIVTLVYLAVRGFSNPPAPAMTTAHSTLPIFNGSQSGLRLTYSHPYRLTTGDSGILKVVASWQGPLPHWRPYVTNQLSINPTCTNGDTAEKEVPQPIGPLTTATSVWTISTFKDGSCALAIRTSLGSQTGVALSSTVYTAQIIVRKPADFQSAFQPYGTALVGLLGSVLGALIGRLSKHD